MANEKIYGMLFNKVFPMLIAKAERKGRKKEEVYEITEWLTGYSEDDIDMALSSEMLNILVRRSRQSGVARATNPDFESHCLLLILLVSDLNHILLA